jgi:hypothetical protein
MGNQLERRPGEDGFNRDDSAFDLEWLLHPAQAFENPDEVVRDPDLTLNEKRSILASWASDACAVDSAPALRASAGGTVVTFDEVMEALRTLDATAPDVTRPRPHYRRVLAKRDIEGPGPAGRHS